MASSQSRRPALPALAHAKPGHAARSGHGIYRIIPRQHLSSQGEYLIGHINDFRHEFDGDCTEHAWLHLLMAENFLLTGRVKAVQSAERLRKDLTRGMIFTEPSHLLSHTITNYPDTLDGLHHASWMNWKS